MTLHRRTTQPEVRVALGAENSAAPALHLSIEFQRHIRLRKILLAVSRVSLWFCRDGCCYSKTMRAIRSRFGSDFQRRPKKPGGEGVGGVRSATFSVVGSGLYGHVCKHSCWTMFACGIFSILLMSALKVAGGKIEAAVRS